MDNDKPTTVSMLSDFQGMFSDADPCDIPDGAMSMQINMFALQVGSLETRLGLKEVSVTYLEP